MRRVSSRNRLVIPLDTIEAKNSSDATSSVQQVSKCSQSHTNVPRMTTASETPSDDDSTLNAKHVDSKSNDTKDPTALLPYLLDLVQDDDSPPPKVALDSNSDGFRALRRQQLKHRKSRLSARYNSVKKQEELYISPSITEALTADPDDTTIGPERRRKQLRERLRAIEQRKLEATKLPRSSANTRTSSHVNVHRLALTSIIPPPLTIVPGCRSEGTTTTQSKKNAMLQLDAMHQDVQLQIVSFLDISSARSFSVSNLRARQLLHCFEAQSLWRDWYSLRWPHLTFLSSNSPLVLVDDLKTPTAGRTTFAQGVNASLLLGMGSQHYPTSVDDECLKPAHHDGTAADIDQAIFKRVPQANGGEAIQFIGQVGINDRSIKSDKPLPGPKFNVALFKKSQKPFLRKVLRRKTSSVTSLPPYCPFVAPFQLQDGSVNITPRLISYFEVEILPQEKDADDVNRAFAPDCVAVGVSSQNFSESMPGWDRHSYGYHSDDGAIFHGSGVMVKEFGPTFGAGDVVGCGVDYVKRGIFYTLNGRRILGYAWTKIDTDFLRQELYTTVGVDTNCPVQFNFGERPFAYNLRSMLQRQASVVNECLLASRSVVVRRGRGHRSKRSV